MAKPPTKESKPKNNPRFKGMKPVSGDASDLSLSELMNADPSSADELNAIWREMEKASHRSAALMAASLLEVLLEKQLKNSLVNLNAKEAEKIFSYPGPLSSFDAKIRIAYAMGLIVEQIRDDLNVFRKVRNAFAHTVKNISFDTPQIVNEVVKFKSNKKDSVFGPIHFDLVGGFEAYDNGMRFVFILVAKFLSTKLFSFHFDEQAPLPDKSK